jgi:tetratricopeptide (TPR) repeat protein
LTARALSPTSARKQLREALDLEIEDLLNNGYQWLRTELLPAIEALSTEKATPADRKLVAKCSYLTGAVYELTGAPLAAITCLKKALKELPHAGPVWHTLGLIQVDLGKRQDAIRSLERSIDAEPSNLEVMMELHQLNDPEVAVQPRYQEGDPLWKAAEAIAGGKLKTAHAALQGLESMEALQWHARACGAADDEAGLVGWWQRIAQGQGEVMMTLADWYYLPEAVWFNASFWEALLAVGARMSPEGDYPCDEGLLAALPNPPSPDEGAEDDEADDIVERPLTPEERAVVSKRIALTFEQHRAIALEDVAALEALLQTYPLWVELAESIDDLKSTEA